MRAYLKSDLPCLGVYMQPMREVFRQAFAAHPVGSFDEWRATVLALWSEARFREERYAAVALAGRRVELRALPVLERLVVEGAWWDLVDALAPIVGELLRRHPDELKPLLRAWSRDPDPWKRRVSIICQLRFKDATDFGLLRDCIEPNLSDPDFFIRKAIGWALREHSKTDPDAVRRYVRDNHERLSPLSRREALKWTNHVHVGRGPGGGTSR